MRPIAFLLALVLVVSAAPVSARCATPSVAVEARRSVVFEGRLESVVGEELTFVVTAVWRGTTGDRVVALTSERSPLASAADVGTAYLVFAAGSSDGPLGISRCGHSAPISSSSTTVTALQAMGLSRAAR